MNKRLISIGCLINDSVFTPRRLLRISGSTYSDGDVLTVFCLGAMITFAKSFLVTRKTFSPLLFENDVVNKLLNVLSIPQITWLITYWTYFLFLFLVFTMCRVFNRQAQFRQVAISLMRLSAFGITMQILFWVLSWIVSVDILVVGSFVVYAWTTLFSVIMIRNTQRLSLSKAVLCFLLPALPIIFFASFAAVAPYLSFLSRTS